MTKRIYCLIHLNTGNCRYMREMLPAMANELNRSLAAHDSPMRWITAKALRQRKEQQQ